MTRRKKHGGARPGSGRKPLGAEAKSARIILGVEPATKARFLAEAERLEMTLTAWATEALELALARGSTR
jgi:hypothetical protein